MEKKDIAKLIVFILIAVLVDGLIVFFIPKEDEDTPETINETVTGPEEVTYSCYDYIMDTMAEPQMYDEEWIPQYDFELYNEIAKEKMPNGTGWNYDEETNTFYRGYLSILRLDFENNCAYEETIDEYNASGPVDNREATYTRTVVYDFANRVYWYTNSEDEKYDLMTPTPYIDNWYGPRYWDGSEGGYWVYDHNEIEELPYTYYFENEFVPGDAGSNMEKAIEYDGSNNELYYTYTTWGSWDEYDYSYYSIPWHIEKIMYQYNALFEKAGSPLYGADRETLESYKNINAHISEEEDDGLLDGPWELDDFDWCYENSDIEWVDDYRTIMDLDYPYIEPDPDGYLVEPTAYVFFMKKDGYSSQYFCDSEDHVIDSFWEYNNIGGAIGAYLLEPALKKAYGFNAVYFYPLEKVASASYDQNRSATPTYEEFMAGGPFNTTIKEEGGYALALYPTREDKTILSEDTICLYLPDYFMDYEVLSDLYNELGIIDEFPYSDDYFFNFICMYDKDYQDSMGLR